MVDSTNMKGYIAYPKDHDAKRPGILVVHEWWGHNDYARKRADMLADLGYVALAVDMYGDGKQAQHPADAQKFAMSVMGNFETAKARFNKALETLKADPRVDPEKTAAIGYCFGGSVVLSMAFSGADLDAVAAFHAGLQLPVQPEKDQVKAKVLVCNGGADKMVTEDQIKSFKKSMDDAGVDYKFISYEGALHAFTNPGATELGKKFELPLAYNEKADQGSWEELKKLLSSVF
jgi:dienelactone hydrolase